MLSRICVFSVSAGSDFTHELPTNNEESLSSEISTNLERLLGSCPPRSSGSGLAYSLAAGGPWTGTGR